MKNSRRVLRSMQAALLGGAATALMSTSAMAADLGSMKDMPIEPPPPPEWTINVLGGLTTDYVFRGVSQSDNDPAVFSGLELGYRSFYVGLWGSSVADYENTSGAEVDVYGGFRRSWNGVEFDIGGIWYTYPGNFVHGSDYVEVKGSASIKTWRDITVTGTVYWSPDYYDSDSTFTFEGKASVPLNWWGLTLSGGGGYVTSDDDDDSAFVAFFGDDNYFYWNVGLSKTFRDHYTLDVRYWGTSLDNNTVPGGFTHIDSISDDRVVGTITFNY